MKKIIVGSGNENKIKEIKEILKNFDYEIVGKSEIGIIDEVEETGETLEENALIKANFVKKRAEGIVIAEDSGLFVRALDWRPGVYSSRFAGVNASDDENNKLLLKKLSNVEDRYGEFRAVIALIIDDKNYYFNGYVKGEISDKEMGSNGFGYDPLFIPHGYDKSFGQLDDDEKNKISHRNMALKKMLKFFEEITC